MKSNRKNLLLVILFFTLLSGVLYSQSFDKTVVGNKVLLGKVICYEYQHNLNGSSSLKFYMLDSTETYKATFNDFEFQSFKTICSEGVRPFFKDSSENYLKEKEEDINFFSSDIFFTITRNLDLIDDEPKVAYISLRSSKVYCRINDQESKSGVIKQQFEVDNIQIEFEDGTIKNIFADLITPILEDGNQYILRFKNPIPISVSSRNDSDLLSKFELLLDNKDWIFGKLAKLDILGEDQGKSICNNAPTYKKMILPFPFAAIREKQVLAVSFSQIIDYKEIIDNDREDYSPANCTIKLTKDCPSVELKKIKRSRILTSRAYSDFLGFQKENPNGLVQSEVSAKIILYSKKSSGSSRYLQQGFLSYIEPKFVFSKIENNNRNLLLDEDNLYLPALNQNKKVFIISPVDIIRHQQFAFDVDLNLWKYNIPDIKSNVRVNISTGINQLTMADSINVVNNSIEYNSSLSQSILNTWRFGYSFIFEIKPERRYGLSFSYEYSDYNILKNNLLFKAKEGTSVNWLNSITADAFLKTNEDTNSTLFFRTRFSFSPTIEENNFLQIQLGFLFDIFRSRTK